MSSTWIQVDNFEADVPQTAPAIDAQGITQPSTSTAAPIDDALRVHSASERVRVENPVATHRMGHFTLLPVLGQGGSGRVCLVRSVVNSRLYAIKVLSKEQLMSKGKSAVKQALRERALLSRFEHPFIVTLWGSFQDTENLYLVMDFLAGGNLLRLIRRRQRLSNGLAKFYAAEVALALHHLHSSNVIHRDVKPENILIGADGHVKLADFGLARLVLGVTKTKCGTPGYMAPEILQGVPYAKAVDWYSFGVLLFEMLAGFPPFPTRTEEETLDCMLSGFVAFPTCINENSRDLIRGLLLADVARRLGNLPSGSSDVFAHPWFRGVLWQKLYTKRMTPPFTPVLKHDGDTSHFDAANGGLTFKPDQRADDPFGSLFSEFEY